MIEGHDLELFERSIRQATERHTGAALDAALIELGWQDALAVDRRAAVSVLFALQGSANVTSSALATVVAAGLGLESPAEHGVILPGLGSWAPPAELAGDQLTVGGLGAADLDRRETVLVVAKDPGASGTTLAVTVERSALAVGPVGGLDPALAIAEVSGNGIPFRPIAGEATRGWPEAVALAQMAVAHELIGAARTMLELARDHANNRIQFGQPIGKFQAVRHRLAEALVAIEAADGVLDAAWDIPSPELAAAAKALAGRGARTTARHCQQVLAGIGFTAEHPFHRYFRRILVLDQLFGSARSLTDDLGTRLLASRQLPALLTL